MDVGLAPRSGEHQSCNPVSNKVALCKMDLIGIGVIIFTVFFLLCCLERIVKFFRKTVWKRARAKNPEVSSPTQSEAPLIDYQQTMSPSPVLSACSDNEPAQIIPLHRCPERSESEPAVIQTTANASRPFLQEMFSVSSFVSIQRPHSTSGPATITSTTIDQPTHVPTPTLLAQDAICPQTLALPSGDVAFGSPSRSSTPPQPGSAHEKSKKRPVLQIGRTRAAPANIAPEIV
ncbi:hypothetical protein M0805_000842 [Coniferiporia weirii]|nr:hypothetical protein M0805_000842 [Coniferiporia weirii]